MRTPWATPDAIATLRALWLTRTPMRELKRLVGTTENAIRCKARKLQLGPRPPQPCPRAGPWLTDAAVDRLCAAWGKVSPPDLARELGATPGAIWSKARALGLPSLGGRGRLPRSYHK